MSEIYKSHTHTHTQEHTHSYLNLALCIELNQALQLEHLVLCIIYITTDAHFGAHEFICPDGLHERDCVRIELVGLVGLVHNGERHTEIQPLEIPHLHTHKQ